MTRSATLTIALLVVACAKDSRDQVETQEAPAVSATLPAEALTPLEGEWTGSLSYLDYGDNETRVTLPTTVDFTRTNKGLSYTYVYTEPNGQTIEDEGVLMLLGDNRVRMGDDLFEVGSVMLDKAGRLHTLVMSQSGEDNNRPGVFFHTIRVDGDRLVMEKAVLLDGATESFVRNEYSFQR